jgi:HlyD family secretion protein
MIKKLIINILLLLLISHVFISCDSKEKNSFQGYIEAEYAYIASPLAGRLDALAVRRGQTVEPGALLFVLEHDNEKYGVDEAQAKWVAAKFQAYDLKTGKRPPELDVYRAQLEQAAADEKLAAIDLARDEELFQVGAISAAQLDRSRTTLQTSRGKISELIASLESGELPGRPDQRRGQAAQAEAAKATYAQADWKLSQKTLEAPHGGLIFDTLYVEGEWVDAGHPVVLLLSPTNIKVRFFVSEKVVGKLQPGQPVEVMCDGCAKTFVGHISYISPSAEYTPPVIFSNETRSKLIFMIEALFSPEDAVLLHPGQPVEVHWHD